MEKQQLAEYIGNHLTDATVTSDKQYVTISVNTEDIRKAAKFLRDDKNLQFDYLFNLMGIDWLTHFTMVYNFESTLFRHCIELRTNVEGRERPVIATLSDLWHTAGYHELEVYDLLGIEFANHPDPRRIFMEEGSDFPLRKDFKDDINLIER